MKKIVYRPDGCVDFAATKAVREGTALTPEELAELGELVGDLLDQEEEPIGLQLNPQIVADIQARNKSEEFWSDPCFTEPLFSHPI